MGYRRDLVNRRELTLLGCCQFLQVAEKESKEKKENGPSSVPPPPLERRNSVPHVWSETKVEVTPSNDACSESKVEVTPASNAWSESKVEVTPASNAFRSPRPPPAKIHTDQDVLLEQLFQSKLKLC